MRYQLAKQAQFVCRKLTVKEITEAEYETIRNEQQGAKYQTIHGTNSVHQVLSHSRMVVPSRTAAQKVNAPSGVVDMRLLPCGCVGCRSDFFDEGDNESTACKVAEYTKSFDHKTIMIEDRIVESSLTAVAAGGGGGGGEADANDEASDEEQLDMDDRISHEYESYRVGVDIAIEGDDDGDGEQLPYYIARIVKPPYRVSTRSDTRQGFQMNDHVLQAVFYDLRDDDSSFKDGGCTYPCERREDVSRYAVVLIERVVCATMMTEEGDGSRYILGNEADKLICEKLGIV